MKRLTDFLKYYRFEIQTAVFLCAFSLTVGLWVRNKPQNHYFQLVYAVICLIFGLCSYFSYRALWRNKWRAPAILKARKLMVGAAHYIMKFLNRFSFFHRKGNLVGGRTSVSYDLSAIRRSEKRRRRGEGFKPPKWKDMETARQKIGFLYYKAVTNRIKSGEIIHSNETPLEISARFTENETENRIYGIYIAARYDERKEINEEELTEIKEKL